MIRLSTQKIRLRALEPKDVDLLYLWENDPEVWIISNTLAPYSKYTLSELVNASLQDIYTSKQLRLMIEEIETDKTIGVLDVFDLDPYHARAGIGILIEKAHRRKGFAEDALYLAKQYLFTHLRLHQIYCEILTNNHASIALFTNAGFQIAGSKKDWMHTKEGYEDVIFMQLIHNNNSNE